MVIIVEISLEHVRDISRASEIILAFDLINGSPQFKQVRQSRQNHLRFSKLTSSLDTHCLAIAGVYAVHLRTQRFQAEGVAPLPSDLHTRRPLSPALLCIVAVLASPLNQPHSCN